MWCLQLFRTTGVLDESKVVFGGGDGQSKQVSEMKSVSLLLDASDTRVWVSMWKGWTRAWLKESSTVLGAMNSGSKLTSLVYVLSTSWQGQVVPGQVVQKIMVD